MGQRLTMNILNNGVRVALIYYHWSAYFDSAIQELKLVKDDILKAKKENTDPLLEIIEGLERRGGGLCIDPPSRKIAEERWHDYNFTMNVNRNDGLLALSEEDMNRMYSMTEGTAAIDILTEQVWNEVDLEYETKFKKEMFETDPFDMMTFDQLENVSNVIEKVYEKYERGRRHNETHSIYFFTDEWS